MFWDTILLTQGRHVVGRKVKSLPRIVSMVAIQVYQVYLQPPLLRGALM